MGMSKRFHHNELERKRRDHIKDSFSLLRDVIPSVAGEKVLFDDLIYILELCLQSVLIVSCTINEVYGHFCKHYVFIIQHYSSVWYLTCVYRFHVHSF